MTIAEHFNKYSTLLNVADPESLPLKFITGSIIDATPESVLFFAFWKPKKKTVTTSTILDAFSMLDESTVRDSLDSLTHLGYLSLDPESDSYSLA